MRKKRIVCLNCKKDHVGQNNLFCCRSCRHDYEFGTKNEYFINQERHEIIEGLLFSDGFLSRTSANPYFRFAQSDKKEEYVKYIGSIFDENGTYDTRTHFLKSNGKTYLTTEFKTRSNEVFESYYQRWYPNGIKIIPEDFKLTALSFYHAYLGDGCIDNLTDDTYRVRLATCSFLQENLEKVFLPQLEQLGIKWKLDNQNEGKYKIVVINRQESIKNFMEFLPKNVIRAFDYKFRCINNVNWVKKWNYKQLV